MQSMKNSRFVILCILVLCISLSACNNSGESTDLPTLSFWHFWGEPDQKKVLQQIIADFEATEGCKVELTDLSWNDGKAKLMAAFNAGNAPDVLELGSDWVAQFSSSGVLAEMPGDQASVGRFLGFSLHPAIWNGRYYAWPWIVDTRILFLNRSLLDASAWGKQEIHTMDDLLQAARAVEAAGLVGFGTNGADAHRLYKKILPFMWTFGGDIFDAKGNLILDSPENVRALTFYTELSKTGYTETQRQLDAAFIQGKVALWNSGAWLISRLSQASNGNFQAIQWPSDGGRPGQMFAGGEYLTISAGSTKKELGMKLIKFITDGKQAERFCLNVHDAGFPADTGYCRSPELLKIPFKEAFSQQLTNARMTPVHPAWLEIEAILEDATVQALYLRATPAEALRVAQQRILDVLPR